MASRLKYGEPQMLAYFQPFFQALKSLRKKAEIFSCNLLLIAKLVYYIEKATAVF